MSNRRVVCAANQWNHLIVLGARHFDEFMCKQILALEYANDFPQEVYWEQGFIDQYGEFLTREEAWLVAQEAGQIIRRVGGDFNSMTQVGKLFSENLY